MNSRGDFSQGTVPSNIIKIAGPMFVAELVHVLYNVVDKIYIGFLEETATVAISGVGVAFPLITLITAFASLINNGGAPLCAMARGEGDMAKAKRLQESSFTLLLIIGISTTVILFIFAPPILKLLGGDESNLPYAISYFRIYVLGTTFVMISLGLNPYINGQGFSNVGMRTVIIGAVLNIALDPLFMFKFNMGVDGAALATVISQFCSAAWAMKFLTSEKAITRITRIGISRDDFKQIMNLGLAGFCFKATNSITQAVVNITLKAWSGPLATLYIGATSLINSIREIAQIPQSCIGQGATPVMSFNYGAKQYQRASDAIKYMMLFVLAINGIVWAFLQFRPQLLIGLFSQDEELVEVTVKCLKVFFGAHFMMAFQAAGQNTYIALNCPKRALFFSLLRKIILILPLTIILPYTGLGVMGVFYAEFISQITGSLATFGTMYFTIWRKIKKAAKGEIAPEDLKL